MATNPTEIASKFENLLLVNGKVTDVQKTKGNNYIHTVIIPAPDEYSHPQTIPVWATEKLADVGTELKHKCTVSGFRRSFEMKNGETGYSFEVKFFA